MTNDEIDEHHAKEELLRINEILSRPVLLIGGLAVQRYVPERRSKDIDIVCDLATQKELLEKAYSDPKFDKEETQTDLRPAYKIKDNLSGNTIYLGSKITERDPYPYIDYGILADGSKPFKYDNVEAENIRIPVPHALAFSKLVSYISRRNSDKGRQDFEDFAKLTNNREFSLNNFITLSQRVGAIQHFDEFFRNTALSEEEINIIAIASPIRFQSILPIEILPSIYEGTRRNVPVFSPIDTNFRFRGVEITFEYKNLERMRYTKTKKLTSLKNNVGSFYDQFHWTGDEDPSFACVDPNFILNRRPPKNIWQRYEVDFQKILKEGDELDVSLVWELSNTEGKAVPFISVPIDNPTDRVELTLDASSVHDQIGAVYYEVLPLMGAGDPVEYDELTGKDGVFHFTCDEPRLLHTYELRWNMIG